jgi:uncharacterized membrane protein
MENQTLREGKTIAIISYITLIGLIIAFVMNNDKRNSFASFHIRQNVGIFALYFVNILILSRFVDGSIIFLIGLGTFILWIIGLIGALKGEEKSVPLFGDLFQDWFKSIG